jgi:histidyl-tRNA synthetase
MIKAVRGTHDILPPDTALWNFVEATVRDLFRAYNFQEIRTPIFEATELFARGVGEETDIVSKEMYTWEDGESSKSGLIRAWLDAHPGAKIGVSHTPEHRPDLLMEIGESVLAVETTAKPSMQGLEQLTAYSQLLHKRRSDRKIELILAYPESADITPRVKAEAQGRGITLEALDYDSAQSLTLRPENTAGVVRAYIEHKLWDRGLNKLYYIGPQFRRERPQKGRYRQFYQIGAEVIGPEPSGSKRPLRDAEVLEMLDTLLRRLKITNFALHINSVGDSKDRATYNDALRNALKPIVGQMCSDCQRRTVTNPLRVFDCKVPEDQPIIQTLPLISNYLSADSKEHFQNVQTLLTKAGVPFEVNPRLVRGLDYYTRTAFEFTHGALGAQNALLGGGRYDGLAELLGSPQPAPGIGFAIGEDRLVLALQEQAPANFRGPDAYVAPVGERMNRAALLLAKELRREGLVVELGDRSYKLKKLLEVAAKMGSRYAVIVGENELNTGMFGLKNLATGEQVKVARDDLAQRIQAG